MLKIYEHRATSSLKDYPRITIGYGYTHFRRDTGGSSTLDSRSPIQPDKVDSIEAQKHVTRYLLTLRLINDSLPSINANLERKSTGKGIS